MSKSINGCGIKVSILFHLLLASIAVLLCFLFLFLVILSSSCIIPIVRENVKVILALAFPGGTAITLVKEIILIPPLVSDKTNKDVPR